MALEPEELQRRRQERALRRAQRKARKRKLILYLCAACVILLACGILIARVVSNGRSSAANTTPVEATPSTVIHIAAAGDLNVTDQVVAAGGSSYDYTKAFMDVLPLLAEADLTLLNFEGNLCGTPYGTSSGSAPQELVEALRSAGVDMLQLANS